MLNLLREEGVIVELSSIVEPQPAERLISEYAGYLKRERALAPSSIERYVPVVARFLNHRYGNIEMDLLTLCAPDIIDFVQQEAKRLSRKGRKTLQSQCGHSCNFFDTRATPT